MKTWDEALDQTLKGLTLQRERVGRGEVPGPFVRTILARFAETRLPIDAAQREVVIRRLSRQRKPPLNSMEAGDLWAVLSALEALAAPPGVLLYHQLRGVLLGRGLNEDDVSNVWKRLVEKYKPTRADDCLACLDGYVNQVAHRGGPGANGEEVELPSESLGVDERMVAAEDLRAARAGARRLWEDLLLFHRLPECEALVQAVRELGVGGDLLVAGLREAVEAERELLLHALGAGSSEAAAVCYLLALLLVEPTGETLPRPPRIEAVAGPKRLSVLRQRLVGHYLEGGVCVPHPFAGTVAATGHAQLRHLLGLGPRGHLTPAPADLRGEGCDGCFAAAVETWRRRDVEAPVGRVRDQVLLRRLHRFVEMVSSYPGVEALEVGVGERACRRLAALATGAGPSLTLFRHCLACRDCLAHCASLRRHALIEWFAAVDPDALRVLEPPPTVVERHKRLGPRPGASPRAALECAFAETAPRKLTDRVNEFADHALRPLRLRALFSGDRP